MKYDYPFDNKKNTVCLCRVFAPYGPDSAYISDSHCPIHGPKRNAKGLVSFLGHYFLAAFLIAGLVYISWHFGRRYEKTHDPDITFAECHPIENNPQKLDCVLYEVRPEIAGIWKAIMDEVNNPTTKEQLQEEYERWTGRKAGL